MVQHISFRRRSGVTFLRPLFLTRSRHCTDKLTFDAAEDFVDFVVHIVKDGGFGVAEYQKIGNWIADVLDALKETGGEGKPETEEKTAAEIVEFLKGYPIYKKAIA